MKPTVDKLPSVEEILAGETQAGVPRPNVSLDDLHRPSPIGPRPGLWSRLLAFVRKVF